MMNNLQQIQNNKQKLKSDLQKQNREYIKIIYAGLIKNKTAKQISKELLDSTINKKIVDKVSLQKAIKIAVRATRKVEKTEESAIPLIAYAFLEKANTYKVLNKSTTKYCNDYEANAKDDAIKDEIEVNRQHQKVFYLASYHEDCAEDHKNYQGKIYVDEKWPSIVKDENIIKYIKRNNFKTIQWVTSEPVWFITRPNCRHYFTALDNKEVVKYTTPQLLVKHKMSTKIGDRQYLQTLGNRKDRKALGEKRNAELVIEKYKERLKLHQDLANISKNDLLMKAIAKDKFLINKWTKYLKELNGGK